MSMIVKAADIYKEFNNRQIIVPVLKGLNLVVDKGQFLTIMGPSGSGKTTLLNILSTIDTPTSGQVWVNGLELSRLKGRERTRFRRENVGFVFQDFNLLDHMTMQDNIALPLALNKVPPEVIMNKMMELTALLDITEHLGKYPWQLSGGQKQRAAMARALISNPSILFADEPTGALDMTASAGLLDCMRSLNETYGTTIICVTHDANAASYSDKVLFMKDGMIYADISKSSERLTFYQNILNMLAVMGGSVA